MRRGRKNLCSPGRGPWPFRLPAGRYCPPLSISGCHSEGGQSAWDLRTPLLVILPNNKEENRWTPSLMRGPHPRCGWMELRTPSNCPEHEPGLSSLPQISCPTSSTHRQAAARYGTWQVEEVKPLRAPEASSCCLTTSAGRPQLTRILHRPTNSSAACLPLRGWALWAETGSFLFRPLYPKLGEKQT